MVYGNNGGSNDKNPVHLFCNICEKKVEFGTEIQLAGKTQILGWDNQWHDKLYWVCSQECADKLRGGEL